MKLYYSQGACSHAPHIALREAGVSFDLVRYDIQGKSLEGGGSLDDINDKGLVPVLELDDGQRLTEVAAILQYIADRAPDSRLAPAAGTMERYRLVEWLNFLATEVHKAFWPLFHGGEEVENRKAREKLAQSFTWIERKLGDRPFLLGDTFSVADAYLLTTLNWTKFVAIDLDRWPNLKAYRKRLVQRPSVTAAQEAEKPARELGRRRERESRAGMSATHSEVHREIRRSVRDFVAREVAPIADRLDNADADIPAELIGRMAALGYFGLTFPERYGGMGLDALAMAIVAEELSRGWLSVGSVMTRMIITGALLLESGTEEQRERFLPRIASGELLTAAAFTEPDAGSDTAALGCRAIRDGDGYALRGEKTWCTFADRAHVLTVLARTDPDPALRHRGLSMFLVEKAPGDGFHPPELAGSPIPTIGYKGMRSFSLAFDGYRVPAENLLGGCEGRGFYQLMPAYEIARIQTAARAVGVAQASLDAALRYAQERVQFGRPIAEHQVIRHKLARMATELEAARQLCYHAAAVKDQGGRCDLEAGYAKVFAAEMAERVTSEGLQIFGGYGYSREFPVQRFWRDARVFRIFEGTSEIQYDVIARRLLERDGDGGGG